MKRIAWNEKNKRNNKTKLQTRTDRKIKRKGNPCSNFERSRKKINWLKSIMEMINACKPECGHWSPHICLPGADYNHKLYENKDPEVWQRPNL